MIVKVSSGWRERVATTVCGVGKEGGEEEEEGSKGEEEGGEREEAEQEGKGEQEESRVAESAADKKAISEVGTQKSCWTIPYTVQYFRRCMRMVCAALQR